MILLKNSASGVLDYPSSDYWTLTVSNNLFFPGSYLGPNYFRCPHKAPLAASHHHWPPWLTFTFLQNNCSIVQHIQTISVSYTSSIPPLHTYKSHILYNSSLPTSPYLASSQALLTVPISTAYVLACWNIPCPRLGGIGHGGQDNTLLDSSFSFMLIFQSLKILLFLQKV